jgi:hypothetical protein
VQPARRRASGMVRFKNRRAPRGALTRQVPLRAAQQRSMGDAEAAALLRVQVPAAGAHVARRPRGRQRGCAPREQHACRRRCLTCATPVGRADAPALLGAFRESLQLNFGDAALGAALASLQGAQHTPALCRGGFACLLARHFRPLRSRVTRDPAALVTRAVKYANPRTGLVVLRCGRAECTTVWAALTLTTHVRGRAAMLRLLHQGGACAAAAA